jgi:hypothetical protein
MNGNDMDTDKREQPGTFRLTVSEDDPDVAYVRLPTHPGTETCKMSKSLRLIDVIGVYKGPDVVLDFDEQGILVGIEVT